MLYDPEMTLRAGRALYFSLNNFGDDGGYADRWIKVKIWRIPIWLPNTEGRRQAVKLHDLHHVLTEYPTTWRGEAEISAWEVGSGGLRYYWAGWWLDIMNIAQGLVVNPQGVYRGFMRGRRTLNLYATPFNEEMLDGQVGEYRRRLNLDIKIGSPRLNDYLAFVFWLGASAMTYLISVGAPIALLIFIVFLIIWR